jgi:Mg-chelatase subunit ChlD
MSFDRPLWLLAFPALALFFTLVQRAGLSGVGARQRRVALGLRIALITLLVLALSGFRVNAGGGRLAVVFVVDRSASVGASGEDRAVDFMRVAARAKHRGDLVAVVAFGKEPRLEFGMTERPDIQRLTATPDRSATDVARALRLAAALFPEGSKRRIVVLTDGRETDGDARREAARLARAGIAVEGLTLVEPAGGDTLIEGIDAPGRVRRGDAYPVIVTVRSTAGGPAHLEITRDGKTVLAKDIVLKPGRVTVPISERAGNPGVHRYEARLSAVADAVPENNRGTVAVIVEGPSRVLIVEGKPGEGASLAAALAAGQMHVDRVAPSGLPPLDELLGYDGTVLVDVPADALASEQIGALRTAVVDAGAGLVTVGGENAYGLGGYRGSDLESLLPVDSEIKDPRRMPSVAEAIVIDTSGSMGRCHCRNFSGPRDEGGLNKTDISRAGAARAIRALSENDIVGVLAFNTESKWVLPLQKLPSQQAIEHGLAAMTAAGGTNIPQALRTAVAELRQQNTKLKHIILFTDGWTNQQDLVPIAAEVARSGVTLSVVATGEGTGDVLAQMAQRGRGRFYAGTNLTDVPQVMMQEAILASRNYVNEGVFRPVVKAETAVTANLSSSPPLLGYVATTAKSAATTELAIGSDDPLLVTWRAGLGTVTSWTSDAKARWSRPWVTWTGFRDFWTRTVRSTFAAGTGSGFSSEARIAGNALEITVEGTRALASDAVATAKIVDPSLQSTELTLDRTGPGSFRGRMSVAQEGTYLVVVTVREGGALAYRDHVAATLAYSAEYLDAAADPSLVSDLARITRARPVIRPAQAFDTRGLRASTAHKELWPWLALVAALVLPIDVAARRLLVSREDLWRALGVVRARLRFRRRHAQPGQREERMERLMEAKRRTRR